MDITGFITLVQNLSLVGYIVMFIIAFLEVLVVVGAFFPGQNLIIASGFVAELGGFNLLALMAVVFVGTVIGNLVSYFLGRFYGDSFLLKFGKYFYVEKKHLDVAKKYMDSHLGKTLIIGRFNHVIRSFVPFIAGTTNVGFVKFFSYTVIGTFLWTVSFVMIGFVLGKSYELAFGYAGALSIIVFVVMSIIFYIFYKKTYKENIVKI